LKSVAAASPKRAKKRSSNVSIGVTRTAKAKLELNFLGIFFNYTHDEELIKVILVKK